MPVIGVKRDELFKALGKTYISIDAIIECLEVFVHTVLYVRKLYPDEIFRRRKIYGVPIFVSIYPALNEYLVMVLKTAKYLLTEQKLEKLEIVFYRNTDAGEHRLESYCVEFDVFSQSRRNEKDVHLYDFEDVARKSLLQLEDRIRGVGKLPSNAKFKLLLHTTRTAYLSLNEKPDLCEFLWFRDDAPTESQKKAIVEQKEILPLTAVERIGMQMYLERSCD
ncbi:DNA polymerase zeta subunit 2 [Culicoides brevitarsis]|uniref:DNA polymerase zeta subunit 2 n=1 Tax=Culicoides brevitarsis TaxID=469753 RepID=UPI00307B3FFF